VAYTVDANAATAPRSGTLTIAGTQVTITQAAAAAACTYAISPQATTVDNAAQSITVTVTTQSGCAWTVQQVDPWLEIGAVSATSGPGTVGVDVQRYKGGNASRTGTMTIAGQTLTVTQMK
jgi:hypothetical protein